MFDSIAIGTSSLLNHAKGLRVVGNNLANVNSPGFKSSQLQFADVFQQGSGNSRLTSEDGNGSGNGTGVASLGAQISFRAGLDQSTGNPLDVSIDGNGFFAIQRDGELMYTRAGDFRFDTDGVLVNSHGDKVMGLDAGGQLVQLSVSDLGRSQPKQTANVLFQGTINLTTSAAAPYSVSNVDVLDKNGISHKLSLKFTGQNLTDCSVEVKDSDGKVLTTGVIKFSGGAPMTGSDTLSLKFTPKDGEEMTVALDFKNTTANAAISSIGVKSQDGYAGGVKTDQIIESDGTIKVKYSNGQEVKGGQIALADFESDNALEEVSGAAFLKRQGETVEYGRAGNNSFGKLLAGHREGSNVDLAEEFGNLILMQRGYQAASHVVSTANDMIQQLFEMKSR